jgi:hypothetical protein
MFKLVTSMQLINTIFVILAFFTGQKIYSVSSCLHTLKSSTFMFIQASLWFVGLYRGRADNIKSSSIHGSWSCMHSGRVDDFVFQYHGLCYPVKVGLLLSALLCEYCQSDNEKGALSVKLFSWPPNAVNLQGLHHANRCRLWLWIHGGLVLGDVIHVADGGTHSTVFHRDNKRPAAA